MGRRYIRGYTEKRYVGRESKYKKGIYVEKERLTQSWTYTVREPIEGYYTGDGKEITKRVHTRRETYMQRGNTRRGKIHGRGTYTEGEHPWKGDIHGGGTYSGI